MKVFAPLLIVMLAASACLTLLQPLTASAQYPEPKAKAVLALERAVDDLYGRLKEAVARLNDTQGMRRLEELGASIQHAKALASEGRYSEAWQLKTQILAELGARLKSLYAERAELRARLEERMADLSERVQAERERALIEVAMKAVEGGNLTQLSHSLAQAKACVEGGRHEEARELLARCMREVKVAAVNNTLRRALRAAEGVLTSLSAAITVDPARGIDNAIAKITSTVGRLGELAEHLEEVGASPNATAAVRAAALRLEAVALHLEDVRARVAAGALEKVVITPAELEKTLEERGEWTPYVPAPREVSIDVISSARGVTRVKVTLTLPSAGFVFGWPPPSREGNEFYIDVRVMRWTGPSAQVITHRSHVYTLGRLEPGTYTFTFKAWGQPVASTTFTVPAG